MGEKSISDLITKIREDTAARVPNYYTLGKVIQASPLRVEVGGTVQDSGTLMKNSSYTPTANDQVLLMPIEDEQRFILICKVVKA